MRTDSGPKIDSENLSDFVRVMKADNAALNSAIGGGNGNGGRINLDPDSVKNGLAQLVLTLVKLLHELLERQALRRIDAGSLSFEEIEDLGLTLMRQAEQIERLRRAFSLEEEDLNIDLGPLGKLL